MSDLIRLVTDAPVWVWPLLAGLIFIGLRAAREREVAVGVFIAFPFFGLISLGAMIRAGAPVAGWTAFALALGAGALAGDRYQGGVLLSRGRRTVRVRGEWMTMATVMAIFWTSYALGVASALTPELVATLPIALGSAALSGVVSGLFAGRALRVLRTRPV